jgi:hypothetical protein
MMTGDSMFGILLILVFIALILGIVSLVKYLRR